MDEYVAKLKVVTPEEHKEWLKKEIQTKGLYHAVMEQLDELMIDCRALDYLGFSHAVECSQVILELIQTYTEVKTWTNCTPICERK